MSESIKKWADDIKQKLKEHDAKRKLLIAEQTYVQAICDHSNMKSWKSYDYDGGCDYCQSCPDCGYYKVT